MARTRAAKPAAEDARPAAVGKLFAETSRSVILDSFGAEEFFDSMSSRSWRRFVRHACVRFEAWMSSSSPLRRRLSRPEYDSEHDAVVRVRRDFCDNVTDKEEFVGRFRATSRLPQYLLVINCWSHTKLKLGDHVEAYLLDHCNVDRRSRTCPVHVAPATARHHK